MACACHCGAVAALQEFEKLEIEGEKVSRNTLHILATKQDMTVQPGITGDKILDVRLHCFLFGRQ